MSTGTLVQTRGLAKEVSVDRTQDCIPEESSSPEEQMKEQILTSKFGQELFFKMHDTDFADETYFSSMFHKYKSGTSLGDWDIRQPEITRTLYNVWDSPKLRKLLAEPVGAPVELTMEEADEIVRLAFGRRHDLPTGKEMVKEVRELLGHSLIERLKKTD
jgi:hypothetical protein